MTVTHIEAPLLCLNRFTKHIHKNYAEIKLLRNCDYAKTMEAVYATYKIK